MSMCVEKKLRSSDSLESVASSVVSRIDRGRAMHGLFIQRAHHDTTLVVKSAVVPRDGLLGEQLGSDLAMITPTSG